MFHDQSFYDVGGRGGADRRHRVRQRAGDRNGPRGAVGGIHGAAERATVRARCAFGRARCARCSRTDQAVVWPEGREDRKGNMNAETKGAEGRSQTIGQAGAGAKLSTEQRTKISTVIKEQNIRPVTNVNFAISVGTRVPREVSFHPLPVEIVNIYPNWRGYEMFLVNDQIIVVNPRTLEIVAVLDV